MLLALIMLFLKNVIYGASVFFTSELSASVDVLDILALRFLMSFVVLFILKQLKIIKIDVGVRDIFKKTKNHQYIKYLIATAVFEPVLYMLFETLGITMTTGITAGVILSLSPISCCICEELILKEKSSLLQKLFLALGIIGVIYIAVCSGSSDGQNSFLGIIFLILAVASGSLFMVFSRKSSSRFSAFEVTYFSALLGTVIFNTVNIIRHIACGTLTDYFKPYFSAANITGFIFLAIISTIIATSMNNYAVSKVMVSTSAAFGGVSTIVTVVIGVLCGEKIYFYHFIGFALILIRMIGVSVISIKKQKYF